MPFGLAILFGSFVGFSMGLTGGGGGIFAVPLLIYGLAIAPREAVGISLASVGGTALLGVLPRLVRGEVEVRTGLLFAIAGMCGAPLGTRLSRLLSDHTLLILFSILMFVIAWRMWPGSPKLAVVECDGDDRSLAEVETQGATCQRNASGELRLNSKCALLLALLGVATGLLSGMFGVGGGFVIVPSLVLFSSMPIHHAVATSLLVIFLVSVSGVSSYVIAGGSLSLALTALFLVGGVLGMALGTRLGKRFSGPQLQRIFSSAIIAVAVFVISKSLWRT